MRIHSNYFGWNLVESVVDDRYEWLRWKDKIILWMRFKEKKNELGKLK